MLSLFQSSASPIDFGASYLYNAAISELYLVQISGLWGTRKTMKHSLLIPARSSVYQLHSARCYLMATTTLYSR